jgi:hypothetical protein
VRLFGRPDKRNNASVIRQQAGTDADANRPGMTGIERARKRALTPLLHCGSTAAGLFYASPKAEALRRPAAQPPLTSLKK